jgi:hypothetical protein
VLLETHEKPTFIEFNESYHKLFWRISIGSEDLQKNIEKRQKILKKPVLEYKNKMNLIEAYTNFTTQSVKLDNQNYYEKIIKALKLTLMSISANCFSTYCVW